MTTMTPPTDTPPPPPPGSVPPPPPPPPPTRRLERSTTDRVAGGVAGGIGEYLGLDPVLFRVLFAVAAFFGGFGLVVYAVLWFALPERGDATSSPFDRLGVWLRAHNVPLWVALLVAVVGLWLVGGFGFGFGGGVFPGAAIIGVVLLVVAFAKRGSTTPAPDAPTVSLTKPVAEGEVPPAAESTRPLEGWYQEARERGRRRRRRSRPVFWATVAAFVVALGIVGLVDAANGVALPVYAVVGAAVVVAGLLVGVILRRPPFALVWLLVPAAVWFGAFAGTHVSLRDGAGERTVRPASLSQLDDEYRLAFGRVTLDLREAYASPSATPGPGTVTIRVAAGQARVLVPRDAEVTVDAAVRSGAVVVDGVAVDDGVRGQGGWRVRDRLTPLGTDGPPLRVVLQVTDGAATIDRG